MLEKLSQDLMAAMRSRDRARMSRSGLAPMNPRQALELLDAALVIDHPVMVATRLDRGALDALAQSGIAEIGNVITGRAAVLLSEAGFPSDLAPPMLLIGRGTMISTLDVQRLVIPMETEFGNIEIQAALKLTGTAATRRAA